MNKSLFDVIPNTLSATIARLVNVASWGTGATSPLAGGVSTFSQGRMSPSAVSSEESNNLDILSNIVHRWQNYTISNPKWQEGHHIQMYNCSNLGHSR